MQVLVVVGEVDEYPELLEDAAGLAEHLSLIDHDDAFAALLSCRNEDVFEGREILQFVVRGSLSGNEARDLADHLIACECRVVDEGVPEIGTVLGLHLVD